MEVNTLHAKPPPPFPYVAKEGESVLIDKGDFRKEKWIAIGLLLLPK